MTKNDRAMRIISLIVFLLCSISAKSYDFQAESFYFDIIEGTNEVYVHPNHAALQKKYTGDIVIPETVTDSNGNSYTVVGIGEYAFSNSSITSINFPSTIRFIGNYAFLNCSQLTTLQLPNSLERIGRGIISKSAVTHIKIPNSVTEIAKYAFGPDLNSSALSCPLESIDLTELSSSITVLPEGMFESCCLKSIVIPNTITAIGRNAFSECSELTTISLPKSLEIIEDHAFYGCEGLLSVSIPSSVTSIGDDAFHGCEGLLSVSIPSSVTSIGSAAFMNCNKLSELSLSNSILSIENYTFADCASLKSVSIPNGVTSIGRSAFSVCI